MSAATAVEAWALPDTLIADLYNSETSFRTWCDSTVFPAEVASLINTLLNQSERAPFGLLDVLSKVMPTAQALEATADAVQSPNETQQAFVASANSSAALNSELESADGLPKAKALRPPASKPAASRCGSDPGWEKCSASNSQPPQRRARTNRQRSRWHQPTSRPAPASI